MFDFLFRDGQLRNSFLNIIPDKVEFQKQILSKMFGLKEGEWFTIRIKDGVKIIIKLNNKCSMHHVYEDIKMIQAKISLMGENDFLFLKCSNGTYQMLTKSNGEIKQVNI